MNGPIDSPRVARWLVRRCVRGDVGEYIIGDLEEEFARRVRRDGPGRSRVWYWRMALASIGASAFAFRDPVPGESLRTQAGMGERMLILARDVVHALRWLRRRPGFTATVVATLAIAVGANTAMFSVINAVLLRGLPYEDANRLVTVWRATVDRPDLRSYLAKVDFEDYREDARTFDALAAFRPTSPVWVVGENAEVMDGAEVSAEYFDVFAEPMTLGRGIAVSEAVPNGPAVVVVSWDLWRSRFGADPAVVGQTMRLNGSAHTIIGVAPNDFDFPAGADLWTPERSDTEACGRNCLTVRVIGRLATGVAPEAAEADLNRIAEQVGSVEPLNSNVRANVVPLEEYTVGDVRRGLRILFGAVGMVLLIACANVATLLFTGATERASQMALRKALGAARGRLIRQVLTESAILCIAGGLLGLLMAYIGIDLIKAAAAGSIPRIEDVTVDATVLVYTLFLMTATTLLFGFAPALLAARGSLTDLLRGVGRGGASGRNRGRVVLIATQVGLSVLLLIGTGLLLRTLRELRNVDLGFDPAGVIRFTISLPGADYPSPQDRIVLFDQLAERIAAVPDVEASGAIAGSPLAGSQFVASTERLDAPPGETEGPNTLLRTIMPGYFETMRIPLLQGRAIEPADRTTSMPVIVVSRNAARQLWPGEDPIGKRVRLGISVGLPEPDARTVVGVVEDVRSGTLSEFSSVEVYIPHAQAGAPSMTFVVRARNTNSVLLPAMRETVRQLDPRLPLRSPGTINDDVARHLAEPGFYSTLLGTFAAIALVLSAVGLYGLVAYQVARRRREIGIRMAIGARAETLVGMIAAMGFKPAMTGLALGLLAAVAARRALDSLLFGVSSLDPITWLTVVLFLALVTGAATILPARRAARVTPTEVLRE